MICETKLDLATIAYNVPWVIQQQIRLIKQNLTDSHTLSIYDNSSDLDAAEQIEAICGQAGVRYIRSPWFHRLKRGHERAILHACDDLLNRQAPYLGFLDHDIFPTKKTSLVKLTKAGFFGVGQTHPESGKSYLWPGFCVFQRAWLDGRQKLDFRGTEGGDVGSAMTGILENAPWDAMPVIKHAYIPVRAEDKVGTQSWAVEQMGDWLHLGNASGWLVIPNPTERNLLLQEMVVGL